MTVVRRLLLVAELEHDITVMTLAGLGALGLSLAVIAYTAWSTP